MIVVITFSLRVKNQLSTQVIGNFEVKIKTDGERGGEKEKNRLKRMKEEAGNER